MAWVICYVVIGVVGIGVLAIAGLRVFGEVRHLSREVSRAGSRIAAVREGIPPLVPAGGQAARAERADIR